MQRVRIGLTGLACVFLLVLIGTASMSNEAPAAKTSQPEEILAQLGLAPGSGEQNRADETPESDPASQPVPIKPPPPPTTPTASTHLSDPFLVDLPVGRRTAPASTQRNNTLTHSPPS